MPELPEVETVARGLKGQLCGRTLKRVEVFDKRLRLANRRLAHKVKDVYRLGKQVVIETNGPRATEYVVVHLRMTGRLLWAAKRTAKFYHETANTVRHMRAKLQTDQGTLVFVDPRRFGTMAIAAELTKFQPKGIDPLSKLFDDAMLARLLKTSKQPMKNWLLRQDRLVGIGNIYASEILFAAAIKPHRRANSLRPREREALLIAIRKILLAAIKHCGTTFSDYQTASGDEGSFQRFLKVYDREGQSCRVCRTPIKRLVQQQRSTYFCPSCQK